MKRAVSIIAKGSYHIGGKKVTIEGSAPIQTSFWPGGPPVTYDPNGDFQAGQMYMQYTRLEDPVVPYPVCMIHGGGSSGALWESTQDGRPGWEFRFLQNGFNVNVSDGVERGRSSWAQFPEINQGPPMFNSYAVRWTTYRLGPKYGVPYEGSRFDYSKYDQFMKQHVPRWTTSNAMVQAAYDGYKWPGAFAWEDNMRRLHERLLELGGDSTWMSLPEMGIRGNTHALMMEDNSDQIADLICGWMKEHIHG